MKKERALWFQAETLGIPNYISRNGVQIDNCCPDYHSVFDQVFVLADLSIDKSQPWIGKVGGYLFFKGTLASTDQIGRAMSFIYIAKDYEMVELRSVLVKDFSHADVSLSFESERCFMDYWKRNKYTKRLLLWVVFLLIVLIFIILKIVI